VPVDLWEQADLEDEESDLNKDHVKGEFDINDDTFDKNDSIGTWKNDRP